MSAERMKGLVGSCRVFSSYYMHGTWIVDPCDVFLVFRVTPHSQQCHVRCHYSREWLPTVMDCSVVCIRSICGRSLLSSRVESSVVFATFHWRTQLCSIQGLVIAPAMPPTQAPSTTSRRHMPANSSRAPVRRQWNASRKGFKGAAWCGRAHPPASWMGDLPALLTMNAHWSMMWRRKHSARFLTFCASFHVHSCRTVFVCPALEAFVWQFTTGSSR